MVPLTGRNSPPPGSSPRNAWNAIAPAPALQQPDTERLRRIMAGRADRERKGRREIERVEADFAVDRLLLVERHREMPAQARTGGDAVDVLEGQLVAGERRAREQPYVPRQRVRGIETEHRREIDAADLQVDAGLGRLRPRLGRSLHFGIDAGAPHLRAQPQRRAPYAARRSLELHRAVAGRDRTIETEQSEQRIAAFRGELCLDTDLAAAERIQIEAAERGELGLRADGGGAIELRRVELDARRAPRRAWPLRHSCRRRVEVSGAPVPARSRPRPAAQRAPARAARSSQ